MDAGLGAQPAVGVITPHLDGGALHARHFTRAGVDDLGGETARCGPLEIHAQQHLRPVLGLGATGARLDVEIGVARVHLAAEHPTQLELADFSLDLGQVTLDLDGDRLVALRFGEFEQFDGVDDGAGRGVHLRGLGRELGALLAELLRLLRLLPDCGVFELPADLFETFLLQVVVKETPVRSARAPGGR